MKVLIKISLACHYHSFTCISGVFMKYFAQNLALLHPTGKIVSGIVTKKGRNKRKT